jgi:hypothetical protein
MPAALTHKSILLLARLRLRRMYSQIAAKTRRSGASVSDLELRVEHLARQADAMLGTQPWPELSDSRNPLGADISKLAVLGSMGPDVPAFAALLAPGQAWIFDTVHKGYPDEDREAVQAGTTDLALEIWRRASAAIAREVPEAGRKEPLDRLRAYILGHLAHLAGDIVSHPYVHAVEWRRGSPSFDHSETEGAIDARVARQVLGRSGTREGQRWAAWWPDTKEVPSQLPAAYAGALEQVYTMRTRRRTGFAEFEERYAEQDPPALSDALIRDGFHVFRFGAIGIGYGWGWGQWFGALSLLALPLLALPPLALAAPRAKLLFDPAAPGVGSEGAWSELLTLPLAATALSSLTAAILTAALTTQGVERYSAAGLVSSGLTAALGVAFLGNAFGGGSQAAPPLRWGVLLGVPVVAGLIHLALLERPRIGELPLVHALPLRIMGLFYVFFAISRQFFGGHPEGAVALWTGIILAAWIWGAKRLRDARIPEEPKRLPADLPHHVRLFDDGTLFHEPSVAAPNLADCFYPSGRRRLLELWATTDLWVRSDGFQLVFSQDGATEWKVVRAPIEPVTAAQYLDLLKAAVPGLQGRVAAPGDPDYVLPPGFTFACEERGEKDPPPTIDRPAGFVKVGSSAEHATPIHHTPKAAQAVRFGMRGPVDAWSYQEPADGGDEDGFHFVHDPLVEGDGETVMDLAADFAALLMLGGASHMLPADKRTVKGISPVGEIRQVFRNWNLDRRRVNEWRMLIAGGALSEKTPPGWVSPLAGAALAEGELTARSVGWVPLLRKWLDAARRPEVDVTADEPLDPSDPNAPNLRALSRGLAFLLDMPDPAKVKVP